MRGKKFKKYLIFQWFSSFMFLINIYVPLKICLYWTWHRIETSGIIRLKKILSYLKNEMWCFFKLPRVFFSNCLIRHRPGAWNSLPFQVIIDILWLCYCCCFACNILVLIPMQNFYLFPFIFFQLFLSKMLPADWKLQLIYPLMSMFIFIPQILFRSFKCRHEWVNMGFLLKLMMD